MFWKIILPNSKPVIATTAINAFINPIVDYIFVSVIMKDNYNNFTVAKGLYTMVDKTNIYEYYTVFCAGAVVVADPGRAAVPPRCRNTMLPALSAAP